MRKVMFCVVGRFAGKDYSKPGFESFQAAMAYGSLKGWTELEVLDEGPVEQPVT